MCEKNTQQSMFEQKFLIHERKKRLEFDGWAQAW